MKKILELYRQGMKPHIIAKKLNMDRVLVDAVLKGLIEPIDKNGGNIRILVPSDSILSQDGFNESVEYPGNMEIWVGIADLKKVIHNLRILDVRDLGLII